MTLYFYRFVAFFNFSTRKEHEFLLLLEATEVQILREGNSILLKFWSSFLNCVLEICLITLEHGKVSVFKKNREKVIRHQNVGIEKNC